MEEIIWTSKITASSLKPIRRRVFNIGQYLSIMIMDKYWPNSKIALAQQSDHMEG